MSLLDLGSNIGNGLLSLLQAVPQAAQGQFAQPPAVDPNMAQFAGPQALAAAQQNYQRNMAAGMQGAAMKGASLGGMGAMAGQQAGAQYNEDMMQAVRNAMLLRQMRLVGQDTDDPRDMIRKGAAMSAMGLPGGDAMISAGSKLLENDPANQTMLKSATTAAALAQANYRRALQQGDAAAAQGYKQEFDTQTQLVNLLRSGGVQQLLPDGSIRISLPESGTTTNVGPNGATQGAMPGAPAAQGTVNAGRATGTQSADIVTLKMPDGSTQQLPYATVRALLGGGRTPGAPANPAPPPAVGQPAQKLPPITDSTMRDALSDESWRLKTPAPQPGRTPSAAEAANMEGAAKAQNELSADAENATKAGAAALTYARAAQAVLASGGNVPTGLTAPAQALVSRAAQALGMGQGDWATKYQELAKYLGNTALQNAKATYGTRMTQNEVKLQLEELSPSAKMTPAAIADMLDKTARIAQYQIDSANRTRYYLSANNDARDFAKWNEKYWSMADATTPAPGLPAGWKVTQH